MDIGIPKETRPGEHRVALTPSGVKVLTQRGHRVWVETGAGDAAGHPDADYQSAGATVAFARAEAFARGALIAAVAAPEAREYDLLQSGQVVFAFWHLPAARPEDLKALLARGVSAVGLEAIEDERGDAPVLTSMSEIAGGLAVTIGAGLLLNAFGGKGILLGGAPGIPPAHLVVIGAGVAGRAATRAALGMGAQVTLLDTRVEPLRVTASELGRPLTTMLASPPNVAKAVAFADLVLGAVAIHGRRSPVVVSRELLRAMRPRTVVLDLSIDMGGCFETSRPTQFPNPVYDVDGILHFCVPNLTSTAARSATLALTNAAMPYQEAVASQGLEAALETLPALRRGVYLRGGHIARLSLGKTFGLLEPPASGGRS
ncbi:MAG TPA: alanine dehydrogenase [Vicinamibacteria bacterium]|nr:alanine dehydrogenase [Vicinamibacteria bacterium]